ncbi:hypothetical protein SFA24_13555 [Legionella pneumophila]|nr:hypothetical protein [Legionella pneumophila]
MMYYRLKNSMYGINIKISIIDELGNVLVTLNELLSGDFLKIYSFSVEHINDL